MKTGQIIAVLVNRYIGVEAGYLGDFTYRTHQEFYPEYCGLDKNTFAIEGTTRERFISIFRMATPAEQGKIILGVLERFPCGEGPKTRTAELAKKLAAEAERLSESKLVGDPPLATNSEMVLATLEDARSLIEHRQARSAVDRVHTAFHGYLRTQCGHERHLVRSKGRFGEADKAAASEAPEAGDRDQVGRGSEHRPKSGVDFGLAEPDQKPG